ncbi:hypothetical protein [Vibrio cholerae]|uniref:hypothetical protein n=1 Tax=Vibrio cholerae TaxID=666 RepID=UPI000BA93F4C|nr:hypothetical protein [Vibrio cholerae]PAR92341.1 hypothetical protein CGT82_17125 [Vibrio cholerae]
MSNLHEIFVDNFVGMAAIKSLDDDQLLYCNSPYESFIKVIDADIFNSRHLDNLIRNANTPLNESTFQFCKYVDDVFKETMEPLFSKEIFNGTKFIIYRTLIKYKNRVSVLVLINECVYDKSNSDLNELKIINICHEMMGRCFLR